MKRRIILTPLRFERLCEHVGRSRSTVYAALRYASTGPFSDEIRRLALEQFDGVEVQKR